MKAIVYTKYGAPEVLQIKEVDKPIPKDNEILVKIKATAVNSGDLRLRKADPFAVRFFFGLMKPKKNILGVVFSGIIEKTGKAVTLFKAGDEIFGNTGMHFGTYAEYVSIPENGSIALKPKNITHTQAAAIPFGASTALHFIKKANIQPGQKVLIYGASGAVGTAAVQLAKHFGAQVTAVCSAANTEMVSAIGADEVFDYTKTNFSKTGKTWDVIFETVNKFPIVQANRALDKNGKLILGASGLSGMLWGLWKNMTTHKKVLMGMATENAADMNFIKKLVEDEKLKAVIDRTYTLDQVAAAHVYAEAGHKKGNLAIEVA